MKRTIIGSWELPGSNASDPLSYGLTGTEATMGADICSLLREKLAQIEEHVDLEVTVEFHPLISDSMLDISLTIEPKGDEGQRIVIKGDEFPHGWTAEEVASHFLMKYVADEFEEKPTSDSSGIQTRMFVLIKSLAFQEIGLS